MTRFTLAELEEIIARRGRSGDENSWTARLFAGGMEKAAQKLGEEAIEMVIAALGGEKEKIVAESADLVYHWLVTLAIAGVPVEDVMDELQRRTTQSGIAEKAARPAKGG